MMMANEKLTYFRMMGHDMDVYVSKYEYLHICKDYTAITMRQKIKYRWNSQVESCIQKWKAGHG